MSDFISSDMLPDIWEEILKRHWAFLETDGGMQKIEEGKKLESCLREFLCIVPHDRKFFLPETAHVLSKSVREMDEFNAYKAIIGFRSISHYANNLFTKPWRKEFRVLKMYSGFYQHEITSNLLDAEKLFEAMGYRKFSNQIFILDGPICPDQVTNVSRDAMAAYVECQIMEHIYAGLLAMGLTCSWQEVFHYREKLVGGSSQIIKGFAYSIKERLLRKEKLINADNCYARIQHLSQPLNITPTSLECPNCTLHNCAPLQIEMHRDNHTACALHAPVSSALKNNPYKEKLLSTYQYPHHSACGISPTGMQHSRSLDHYSEPAPPLLHRHSFDHQQKGCTAHHVKQHIYDSPYDCLDGASLGGSSVSYAAVVATGVGPTNAVSNYHPYNISGNRYPLPYNISNQLNSHYTEANATCNNTKGDIYNNLDNCTYASVSKTHNCNYHQLPMHELSVVGKNFQTYRQRSFPTDQQLIEFDDHAIFHGIGHCNSFGREPDRIIEDFNCTMLPACAQPKDIVTAHQCTPNSKVSSFSQQPLSNEVYGSNGYACPVPKTERSKLNFPVVKISPKYERNSSIMEMLDTNDKPLQMHTTELKANNAFLNEDFDNGRKVSTHRNEASDISYDSNFDDFVNTESSEQPMQRSPTQASKNQDGVGSFESWNYVFKNLERSGYSKDLGERGDLLVQSLDLDSLNLPNGVAGNNSGPKSIVERRRSNNVDSIKVNRLTSSDFIKAKTIEKSGATSTLRESEKHGGKKVGTDVVKNQEKSMHKRQPLKKSKSVLKQPSNAATSTTHDNNANNETQLNARTKNKTNKQTILIANSTIGIQSEWSCHFCTFLNPDTVRICQMCSHSKSYNIEPTISHTPTCV